MSFDCGRKPVETHIGTGRTHNLHTERLVGLNPGLGGDSANHYIIFFFDHILTFYINLEQPFYIRQEIRPLLSKVGGKTLW